MANIQSTNQGNTQIWYSNKSDSRWRISSNNNFEWTSLKTEKWLNTADDQLPVVDK